MSATTTPYELAYARKVNRMALLLLAAHVPVLCGVAWVYHNSIAMTLLVMLLLLAGPGVLLLQDSSSGAGGPVIALAAMGMSALTIYLCNGLIEAHFEIFVLIALLAVFGRVAPLLVAGGAIAVQHVVFWMWIPTGVFNYKASFGVVLVHAFFVVLEVIPVCWIARQFGKSIRGQGIVVEHLGDAAERIAAASGEVSVSSEQLVQGVSQQAASIEKTSASAARISEMARRNTEASGSTATMVTDSARRIQSTDVSLTRLVTAMNGINESSDKISRIIKVIDQISFQTNILALNAAVEAARAGEAGMGFAVVAEEVRSLAQRCARAAQDTSSLIEDCVTRSRSGVLLVEQVAVEIRSITVDSGLIKGMVDEISDGSREQSSGVQQITKVMRQMEQVTQNNAAAAQETAAAVEELNSQAVLIKSIVDRLSLLSSAF